MAPAATSSKSAEISDGYLWVSQALNTPFRCPAAARRGRALVRCSGLRVPPPPHLGAPAWDGLGGFENQTPRTLMPAASEPLTEHLDLSARRFSSHHSSGWLATARAG